MPLPCTPWWWEDSAEKVQECSSGASPPQLFAQFFLEAGGTHRRRKGLPWPLAWQETLATAEAHGQLGSGVMGALFVWPLTALCSQDSMLFQPIR